MAKRDFYEVLGIDRGADGTMIKKAYRKLAMEHHPDRNADNPDAEAKFKEANEAYEILKDEQKRAAYDQFGHSAFEGGMGGGGNPGDFGSSFADVFDDLFGEFMGGGGRRRGGRSSGQRGADLRYNMEVTLEDAFAGKQAKIRVPTAISCDSCGGSGADDPEATAICTSCAGHGKVRAQQGFFSIERTCPTCGGTGKVIRDPCKVCSGSGRIQKEKTLNVTIPAGVDDGMRIRLTSEGEAGVRGGPAGDLYIVLGVKPHPIFQRDGGTIYCPVPITVTTAALGGAIEVPTIEGKRAKVSIPAGTQAGRQFRLRGKGMTGVRGSARGDMIIETMVETPIDLTARQKELLKEFEEAGGTGSHSPESDGFFTKVKDLWQDLTD
ncbi:MAG: molecular chaperone DnaJ [Rhodospirillaceae bacterium]|jgi:molecular chaperone DnaJ|nr:molecular chaperone DnaJ [Rhodospirillaceae bacterium]MBT6203873.1 molecular chaperone DnaJ [Rhodospirillaceae bacterium]MBT6512833.1 molecular chaperone DnaJ [Rhodospirillaceae bacterium]MBT7647963.1 molecular chaperone DnaJ [Rhodospirillaceae bacterium]